MKAVLLGAGAIGSVIASLLGRREEVEHVLVADRSLDAAKALATTHDGGRLEAARIDASDVDGMAKAFRGYDLVLNVVLPRFNLKIMDACLKAGVHYMDAATDLALAREKPGDAVKETPYAQQLRYDDGFRAAGLTALLGMGADPGLSNIFARLGADRLDTVEEVLVRDGDSGQVQGHEFVALWSPDTLIEEVLMPALAFRDGRFVRLGSLEGEEVFDFPPPVGPLTVYNVDHEETETLPLFIGKGILRADFKLAIPKDLATALSVFQRFGLHAGTMMEVEVKGSGERVRIAPRDILTALLPNPKDLAAKVRGAASIAVVVRGTKGGKRDGWMFWFVLDHQETFRKFGFNATAYPVGAPMAMSALMIGKGEIARRGAFPPEVLDPMPFFRRLPEFGILVREKRLP